MAAFGLLALGLQQDLPYGVSIDEPTFVLPAVRIAASGDPNPHWFGHPGSTVIYPLAAVLHLWNTVTQGGNVVRPDASLQAHFVADPGIYYVLGRLLSILYLVSAVPLTYQLAKKASGRSVAVVAPWLLLLSPVTVYHAQLVRTDTAGLFFTVLALWALLRVMEEPSLGRQVLAGAAIGLAIATRYLLAALVPIAFLVEAVVLWRSDAAGRPWRDALVGLLAIPATFLASTPFLLLDYRTAIFNLTYEARDMPLPGGHGVVGRLVWYLTEAHGRFFPTPLAALAAVGVVFVAYRRNLRELVLLLFALVFLAVASVPRTHWLRWLIPVLPVAAILAGAVLVSVSAALGTRARRAWVTPSALLLLVTLASLAPARATWELIRQRASPSTQVLATRWVMENVPPGTAVALDAFSAYLEPQDLVSMSPQRYAAPQDTGRYRMLQLPTLADVPPAAVLALDDEPAQGGVGLGAAEEGAAGNGMSDATEDPLDAYVAAGYCVFVSSDVVWRTLAAGAEPGVPAPFYRELFEEGQLLYQVGSSPDHGGPIVEVFRYPRDGGPECVGHPERIEPAPGTPPEPVG